MFDMVKKKNIMPRERSIKNDHNGHKYRTTTMKITTLLQSLILIFCLISAPTFASINDLAPSDVRRYSAEHSPEYIHATFMSFYNDSDTFTQRFIRNTWPEAHRQLSSAGVPPSDRVALYMLAVKESTWDYTAQNPNSSAVGYCQSMASDHAHTWPADFLTNPISQLAWCHGYAYERYGDYVSAVRFWEANNWW